MTYNKVLEGCFYKGQYNYLKIDDLVLRMRLLEMVT